MRVPFGHTVQLTLSLARPGVCLGPGWAMLSGALSTAQLEPNLVSLLRLVSLWLLVDPLLGGLWHLAVEQGLWRALVNAHLPPPPADGFSLPYVQPGSLAARWVIYLRRGQAWWRDTYQPVYGDKLTAFGVSSVAALLMGLFLAPTIFWLTLLAIGLVILAGLGPVELTDAQGGRLQSVVQFLLPWAMGAIVWQSLSPLGVALAACGWVTYLGGLRMAGQHQRADWLFWLGQAVTLVLLLGLRLLPGAALLSVLLAAQWLIKIKFTSSTDFLQKVQPYLVAGIIVAGWSLGSLP